MADGQIVPATKFTTHLSSIRNEKASHQEASRNFISHQTSYASQTGSFSSEDYDHVECIPQAPQSLVLRIESPLVHSQRNWRGKGFPRAFEGRFRQSAALMVHPCRMRDANVAGESPVHRGTGSSNPTHQPIIFAAWQTCELNAWSKIQVRLLSMILTAIPFGRVGYHSKDSL